MSTQTAWLVLVAMLVGAAGGSVITALLVGGRHGDDRAAVDQALADMAELAAEAASSPDVRRRVRVLAGLIVDRVRPAWHALPDPSPMPGLRPESDGEATVPLPVTSGSEPSTTARDREARLDAAIAEAWLYVRGFGSCVPDGADLADFGTPKTEAHSGQ